MKFISNIHIGKRLALGFGAISAMLVVISCLGLAMLGRINQGTDHIVSDSMPKIAIANALADHVNDIAIGLRNNMLTTDPADRQKQVGAVLAARAAALADMARLERMAKLPRERELVTQLRAAHVRYAEGQDVLMGLVKTSTLEQARSYMYDQVRAMLDTYKRLIAQEIALQSDVATLFAASAHDTYLTTRTLLVALSAIALLCAALLSYTITHSVTTPLAQALKVAHTVAAGDLSSTIIVTSRDEMGQLLQALKGMNDSLARTVGTVRASTDTIAAASAQVAAGSQELSSRTEHEASSLEETASSMEELTATVKQNADNARQAHVLADTASGAAQRGGAMITQVVATMDQISASSSKITDIIGVIDGIAFQTNILALNAAVEAARAGEQGRGFAVVATEVRNLAQRSSQAAREIKHLIDDSTASVASGSALVHQAGASMTGLVDSVRRVTDIMGEITSASAEQTAGIEQINRAISEMDIDTQENAALVEESAAAAAALREQAATLAQVVSVFKLGDQPASVKPTSAVTLPVARPVPASPAHAPLPARQQQAEPALSE
ncbi:methyl-accepting chemotaxis protein [Janthinobacterium psychrotolerans]|uniref:Methyl-accepting chemotaxis protein n=1 Tax=Janthinobacterium psychrotolerans TaxID=1747903 RepID=A0A1A7C3G6_9BURK|nr:methyl-accepting chemotaxis protein [Janthinobacterium psychrotolerans]OBV39559.1 methyl-accepting chemotaxis protein [Janthinobacterium psychrotolerans]